MPHSYPAHLAARHKVQALHAVPSPHGDTADTSTRVSGMHLAPDTVRRQLAATDIGPDTPAARVMPLPSWLPTPPTCRDRATRIGAIVPVDDHNRANLKKLLALLGWDPATDLVATGDGSTAVVSSGRPTAAQPWLSPVRVDTTGRITLPRSVKGALRLRSFEGSHRPVRRSTSAPTTSSTDQEH